MSPLFIGITGLIVLFALLALGMPIGVAMALVGFVGYVLITSLDAALSQLATVPYATTASYLMSVLPLFMLMGQFAFVSKLVDGAYNAMNKWLGRLPGGLAMATIGGCAAFAAVCGSSVATASTMTSVAYPGMKTYNYDPELALGTIAAGGTLGILIPPSVPMIVYAVFADESVGKLFIGGILPGILLTSLFMIVIYIRVHMNPQLGPRGPITTWSEKLSAFKDIGAVAILAILVMGGIWGGIFSPTEAGGVGALGAFAVGVITKRLTFKTVINCLRESIKMTAMCLTILIGAMIFNYFIVVSEVATQLSALIDVLPFSQKGVMSAMLIIFLILGCIMDTVAITVLTLPIFLPALTNMGFDLVWFGVVFTVMCEMALITPPIGMNVFIISGMVKDVPMYTVFKGTYPFFMVMILCVILLILFPQIVLFLPNTIIG